MPEVEVRLGPKVAVVGEPNVPKGSVNVQKAQPNVVLGCLLCERDHALGRDVACEHHNVVVAVGGGIHQDGLKRYREVGDKELVAGKDENDVVKVKRQLS